LGIREEHNLSRSSPCLRKVLVSAKGKGHEGSLSQVARYNRKISVLFESRSSSDK